MTTTDDRSLRIERLIDAPIEAVYRAWTTKEALEQWYRDKEGFGVTVRELDVRVGGGYHVTWGPPGGPEYAEHGRYLELDPPHRIVMSETLVGGPPSGWEETTVTVELADEQGKTRLTLTHAGFGSAEIRDMAERGWPGFLDRIDRLLAAG